MRAPIDVCFKFLAQPVLVESDYFRFGRRPDSFANGPSIAVFEALDDHKEHDPECTPLGPR